MSEVVEFKLDSQSDIKGPSQRGTKKVTVKQKPFQLKVMLQGETLSDENQKIVKKLGGQVVTNIQEQFHVLVLSQFKRTPRLLQAVNIDAQIVSPKWLTESQKEGVFLGFKEYSDQNPIVQVTVLNNFRVRDSASNQFQQQYGVNLELVYLKANARISFDKAHPKLLHKKSVYVSKSILHKDQANKDKVKQDTTIWKTLIEGAGGTFNQKSEESADFIIETD